MDAYLVRGLVWCGLCGRLMVAVHNDAGRAYSCGQRCPQPDLPACPLEQDLLLRALVRAHTTLYGIGRTTDRPTLPVTPDEVRRWQWCDLSNRRAVLHTAFAYVTVDATGAPQPMWRHQLSQPAKSPGQPAEPPDQHRGSDTGHTDRGVAGDE